MVATREIEKRSGGVQGFDPVTEAEVRAVGVTDFRPWVDAPHHDTRRAEDDYIRDWDLVLVEPDQITTTIAKYETLLRNEYEVAAEKGRAVYAPERLVGQ